MTTVIVDASVAVKWFAPEIYGEHADFLLGHGLTLIAPNLLPLEVGNALLKKLRAGEVTAEQCVAALEALEALVDLHPAEARVATTLQAAIAHATSIYDATYIALAMETGHSIVTADRRLYEAVSSQLNACWIEEVTQLGDDDDA